MSTSTPSGSEKPDRFKKITTLWYNFKTCQVYLKQGPKVLQNKAFCGAIVFTLFLYILEESFFEPRHIIYIWSLSASGPWTRLAGMGEVALSFLTVVLFLWAALASSARFRVVYCLIFASAILVQYNYWSTVHRFMSVADLNTAVNSPLDMWLDAAALFFNWFALLPLLVYLAFQWWSRDARGQGLATFILLLFFVGGSNSALYLGERSLSPGLSLQEFFKTLNEAMWSESVSYSREAIEYRSETRPQNNIVLVIDESVRGDHLSVNGYHRPTTPYLEELAGQGYVHNWGTAVAAATCSMPSNAVIIAGLSQLPDTTHRLKQNPTLFHYAKAMGYETYHYDAQTKHLWNGISVSDLPYLDHWITIETLGRDREADFRAADGVLKVITNSTGNFIVINKKGVHFHYNDVYPPEQSAWTPIPARKAYDDPVLVANTYDNGVRYNVDNFFRRLIPDPAAVRATTILYTSDHGQTLIENGEYWSHCGETQNEALVPLLLIGDPGYAVDTASPASHYNIFATLLDLMRVPDPVRLHDYPPSLFAANAANPAGRYFLGGNSELINFDG